MTENVTADAVCGYNVSAKDNVHNGAIESSSDSGSCGYYVDMVKDVCNVEYTYHVDYTHMVANTYMIAHVYTSHIVCPVSRTLNVTIVSDAYHVDSVCRVSDVNYIHSSVMPHSVFPEYIVYSGYKEYGVYLLYHEYKQHRPHGQHHVFHVGTSSFCSLASHGISIYVTDSRGRHLTRLSLFKATLPCNVPYPSLD